MNMQLFLYKIHPLERTKFVTGLSILVPADGSSRNGVSFTLQGKAVVYFDLHFFRGETHPRDIPFVNGGWNCKKQREMDSRDLLSYTALQN